MAGWRDHGPGGASFSTALGVAALLSLTFAVQAAFVLQYPQPELFGDPAGYHSVGRRLVEAASRLLAGETSVGAAFESVRGVLYFAGPGLVFGALDALRPGDLGFLRLAFAAVNTVTALVVFLLGRELSGSRLGGFASLLLYALHPSFPVELAKLFPDPVTGLLFAVAALLFVTGVSRRSVLRAAASGAALGSALLVRSQLMDYVLILLGAALLASLRAWFPDRAKRRLAVALVAGLAPFAIAWGGIVSSVGDDVGEIEALGNFTFRSRYPYGFWQFLDSDGFMGPYRLGAEPYFQDLQADAQQRGWDAGSRREQWLFTARYVARRGRESLLLLLDNAFRLYDRPPNRYKWDYPYAYERQLLLHRVVMALALGGLPLLVARRRSLLAVFFLPAALAILHALSYPWPRFAQPVLPLFVAAAGASVALFAEGAGRLGRRDWLQAGGLAAGAAALWTAGQLSSDAAPAFAAGLRLLGVLSVLGLPLLVSVRMAGGARAARLLAAGLAALIAAGLLAHTVRGDAWHSTETRLGGALVGVEQHFEIPPEALGRLERAAEAWLVFDVRPPDEGVAALTVEVGGRRLAGSSLVPTLPPLREFTLPDGPPRRRFAQWWGLALDAELRAEAKGGRLRVRLSVLPGGRALVAGDRFAGQQSLYEGPSFGDWPNVAAIKFDYDGDSRLRVRRPLASSGTTSYLLGSDGALRPMAAVHRIRIVTLASSEAELRWKTAPAARAGATAFLFGAYSRFSAPDGVRGHADLLVGDRLALAFPLESHRAFRVSAGEAVLCHRPLPDRPSRARGAYALFLPVPEAGASLTLAARFRSGLSAEEMMFRLDPRTSLDALAAELAGCLGNEPLVNGAAQVLDETRNRYPEDTGRFRVDAVY